MIIGRSQLKELVCQGLLSPSEAVRLHIIDQIQFQKQNGRAYFEHLNNICEEYGAPQGTMAAYLKRHGLGRAGGNGARKRVWTITEPEAEEPTTPPNEGSQTAASEADEAPHNEGSYILKTRGPHPHDEGSGILQMRGPTRDSRIETVKDINVEVEVVPNSEGLSTTATTLNSPHVWDDDMGAEPEGAEETVAPEGIEPELFVFSNDSYLESFPDLRPHNTERSEASITPDSPAAPSSVNPIEQMIDSAPLTSPEELLNLWLALMKRVGIAYRRADIDLKFAGDILGRNHHRTVRRIVKDFLADRQRFKGQGHWKTNAFHLSSVKTFTANRYPPDASLIDRRTLYYDSYSMMSRIRAAEAKFKAHQSLTDEEKELYGDAREMGICA